MTYQAGIGEGLRALGLEPRDPHVVCDGCKVTERALTVYGLPKAWAMNGRAPNGWKLVRNKEDVRRDYCPKCKGNIPKHAEVEP